MNNIKDTTIFEVPSQEALEWIWYMYSKEGCMTKDGFFAALKELLDVKNQTIKS